MKKETPAKGNHPLALHNLWLKMKITTILLFLACFCLQANNSFSQNATVNLEMNDASLTDIFKEIENQTEYRFFYNNNILNNTRKLRINIKGQKLSDLLNQIFKDSDITYSMVDRYIVITTREDETEANAPIPAQLVKKTIAGVVTDPNGDSIIGANVVEKGTTNGTITDIDGQFTLSVSPGSVLQITYIGFKTVEVTVGEQSLLRIEMVEDSEVLSEVVVTALGIKREEKALGYAVQKVSSESLTMAKGFDITSSLTGKIAGLNIQNSTEFNEKAEILLRGEKPLLIIDGVPYDNMSLNELAADDILSIDVLKGATASALYGSRGGTGALMVTTKRGEEEGLKVSINSNTMFFTGYLAFPEVQHGYSAGTGGRYNNNAVWGNKLDIGRTEVMWDPYTYEFREQELVSKGKDNFKNFLQFSWLTNNNISVSQKGKYGSIRASLTHGYNRGQYPNQDLNKLTFFLGGDMTYGKFKLDASASYNKRKVSNEGGAGYSSSYIYDLVIWGGTEYDVRDYRNYWIAGKEHVQQNWYDDSWYDNPYFKANEVITGYDTDVFNASANLTYEFTPWLKAMGRAGIDVSTKKNIWRNALSANYGWDKRGYYAQARDNNLSTNADAILMADKTFVEKFNVNFLAGTSIYYSNYDYLSNATKGGLSTPGFYSLYSSMDPALDMTAKYEQKRVNSLYGKLSLSWASTYFLDVTGRNDWSSTLRPDERSYFYPSISGSIVLSEIFRLPEWWDFLKVRGSWTTSKKDADIYYNNNLYNIKISQWGDLNTAEYPTSLISRSILPRKTETWEVGLGSNMLNNRLHFDFAYYHKMESDFIINGTASPTTGFTSIQTNSKEKRLRQGIEVIIGGTPIKTRDFSWDILTNWGHDRYTYAAIDPEFSTKSPWVKKGERYDWIDIYDWDRDPQGNIIHNGGMPIKQTFKSKVAHLSPDLVWGITNTFKYKDFTLMFTIDGRVGGNSYSRTHQMLWNSGAHVDSDNKYRYEEVVNGNLTYIGQGVKVISGSVSRDPDGNILEDTRVYAPNDEVVSYEAYITRYHGATSNPSRQNVLDETFFKLRNLSITYDLPSSLCKKMGMTNASVGLTGQNLLLWAKDYKYADPDKGGSSGDSYGYESLNSPSQRYMGVNIKIGF